MAISCNICGSLDFQPFNVNPRENAQCANCGSLERHRALHYVLNSRGFLRPELKGSRRCLQLAPEKVTYDYISQVFGSGYTTSDLTPEKYKHAKCLKLALPEGFQMIPDEYFYLILHNHVLEHIPGRFSSHVDQFYRILEYGGSMIFTIPDSYICKGIAKTVEGGEDLPSDEDRLKKFGQGDHYKWLGLDFVEYLRQKFSAVELLADRRNEDCQELIVNHNAFGIVFLCKK